MWQQINYFGQDVLQMLGRNKARIIIFWLSRTFWGVFSYRLDRGLTLMLGKSYSVLRIFISPLFYFWQAYSNIDIHRQAIIGPGLKILHSSMGIVISGNSLIGKNLTMVGGNVIGAKEGCKPREIQIGDNCFFGANAVLIGPIKIGSNIKIGALSLVIKDFPDGAVLGGVPAKQLS